MTRTFGYYWGTGQVAQSTDVNNNYSYFHFYDPMNRLTATSVPNGGWTRTRYSSNDTTLDNYTGITSAAPSGNSTPTCTGLQGGCRWDEAQFDGLGRRTSQVLESDPDGAITVAKTYDNDGRVGTSSNPYRTVSDPTYGLETPSYDGLDRTIQVKHGDTNIAHTYYGANVGTGGGALSQLCASSTYGLGYPLLTVDEAGNKRQTWTDGFGRVIETDEPGSNGSLTVGTCYTYDLNSNLLQVTSMGLTQTQKPTYTYDMISRMTSKALPESGTTNFYYTTSGGSLCSGDPNAVCRRADARNITTTYTYDAVNRIVSISYNDANPTTPTVKYGYDAVALTSCTTTPPALTIANGLGQRTSMCDGSGATAWSFNSLGELVIEKRTLAGQTKTINYGYNLDGSIYTIQYPGTRTITYTEGNAQRITQVVDTTNGITYVKSPSSGAMFSPFGTVGSVIHGYVSGGFAGITESYSYNNRLEVTGIQATSSAGTVLNLAYSYVSGNNGNIATQTNNQTNGRTQNYTYDSLNRLLTAQTQATSGGDCWGQSFGNNGPPPTLAADALANLFYTTATQCSAPQPRFTVNTSNNNQFAGTGIGYDSDGDMTADTAYTYTYDAENRMITASGMTNGPYCYTYDGNGMRVMKAHASGGNCTGTVAEDMLYWRNIAGNTIAETDGTGSTTNANYNEYVFFSRRRIAQSNPSSGNIYYFFADHLGSTRVVTNATGTACYEADYLPYGTENTPSGFSNTCTTRYRFTGYERDLETAYGTGAGNDYAFARYYNSRLSRFMSRDPLGGSIADPQTLNGYTYGRDNATRFIDPTGMFAVCIVWQPFGIYACYSYADGNSEGEGDDGIAIARILGLDCGQGTGAGVGCGPPGMDQPGSYIWCVRQEHSLGVKQPEKACRHELAQKKTEKESRIQCASKYGQDHSIAAAFGAQDTFVGNVLGGNSVSGLLDLGQTIFGGATPTPSMAATTLLGGGAQGFPAPPGHPGMDGAAGRLQNALLQTGYGAIRGVGQETLELGVSASGDIASVAVPLSETALFGVGIAKLAFDTATVGYGYFFACHE